jgi:hypothetical protein
MPLHQGETIPLFDLFDLMGIDRVAGKDDQCPHLRFKRHDFPVEVVKIVKGEFAAAVAVLVRKFIIVLADIQDGSEFPVGCDLLKTDGLSLLVDEDA